MAILPISMSKSQYFREGPDKDEKAIDFQWLVDNDRFDSVVGIASGGKPVSTGVLIESRLVLTSANPIRGIAASDLQVFTVWGASNLTQVLTPNCDSNPYWKKNSTPKFFLGNGTKKHSPLHDLKILAFETNVSLPKDKAPGRQPYFVPVADPSSGASNAATWEYAGFGYLDQSHVEENQHLEVEYFQDQFVDCDEYIPRSWGIFFCVENKDSLLGVASGSPLFHQDKVYGIGSFALQKGNDSVLVFTDLRMYNIRSAVFCMTESEVRKARKGLEEKAGVTSTQPTTTSGAVPGGEGPAEVDGPAEEGPAKGGGVKPDALKE